MQPIAIVAIAAPAFPAGAALLLGLALLSGQTLDEKISARLVSTCFTLSAFASFAVASWLLFHDHSPLLIHLGTWVESDGYAFEASLLVDGLSTPMMVLTATLCGLIGRFSATYLHREPGQPRFFLLLSLFATGMFVLVMAGSLDLLIAGWEIVGLSSMLLIGFFHERTFPVRNAVRTFVTYRVCDIGLLVGTVLMHHYLHTGTFAEAFGLGHSPSPTSPAGGLAPTLIVLCLFFASSGKSALFPVGSWLPRAMEGPTPSSAIFYGALSVHAGAYLMLRMMPLLEHSAAAQTVITLVGLLTAIHGTLVQRVQTDVKSQLAYATTTQVGVIFLEIGLGFPKVALFHLVSHACLRTVQMLRAPNVIHDVALRRSMAVSHGAEEAERGAAPSRFELWLYHLSLERFHLDALLERFVARPVLRLARLADLFEHKLLRTLAFGTEAYSQVQQPEEAPLAPRDSRRAL